MGMGGHAEAVILGGFHHRAHFIHGELQRIAAFGIAEHSAGGGDLDDVRAVLVTLAHGGTAFFRTVNDAFGRTGGTERIGQNVVQAIGRIGMTVCYDLWFAELFRRLADGGAEIITVPAAFTAATGRDHWQLLLRARAVENQVFVIGANMVDRSHPRRALWGGSAIIDPWGNVLAEIAESAGVAVAEIDFTRIAQVRQKMPVSAHRKL